MFDLKYFQYTSMMIMFMLAFFAVASRFFVQNRNRLYEQSRWMVVAALLLFGVHYMMQILFGWRAKGDDIGTLFNILFYMPCALLLANSQLNILMGGRRRWRCLLVGVLCYALAIVVIGTGVIINGSLHIGWMLYLADAINMAMLIYYIWLPYKELRKVQHRLDSELGYSIETYAHTMRVGVMMLCSFVALSPWFILSMTLLSVFGPLALFAVGLFVVSFVALGFNLTEGVTEIATETYDDTDDEAHMPVMTAERIEQIETAISKWQKESGFKDSNLTLASFTRRIMVKRTDFTSYLSNIHGNTFRTWLSAIRVREAKRLMTEHPEYSNEVVSAECGFSSRVYFQRLFKEKTGLTPAEWKNSEREAQRGSSLKSLSILPQRQKERRQCVSCPRSFCVMSFRESVPACGLSSPCSGRRRALPCVSRRVRRRRE